MAEDSEKNQDHEKKNTDPTGMDVVDLIKAPVEPPQPNKTRDTPPPARGQMRSLGVGFLFVLAGLAIWPIFGPVFAWVLITAGAVLIAIGTMFRI